MRGKPDKPEGGKQEVGDGEDNKLVEQTSIGKTSFSIFSEPSSDSKQQQYDKNEELVFCPNTKGLSTAWPIAFLISLEAISQRLCLSLYEMKNEKKLTSCFSVLSELQEDKVKDFTSTEIQFNVKDIQHVLTENLDLLLFLGLDKADIDKIANLFCNKQPNQERNLLKNLSDAIEEVMNNKSISTSFQSLSYNATLINARLLKEGKINNAYELMMICAVQRRLIADVLKQEYKDLFGLYRDIRETKEERAVTPLSVPSGRYEDQVPYIKNLLTKLKGIRPDGVYSEYVISTIFPKMIVLLKQGDTGVLPLNENLDNIGTGNYNLYLRSAKLKDVETILLPLKEINLKKLQLLSDEDFFIALGGIYQAIADACPFSRGSASIAQMVICSLMKSVGKPLLPFSQEININPDILSSLLSKEEFTKSFIGLFDKKQLSEGDNLQTTVAPK
ncbi:Uncharacterised protein [Legionella busanensis]|uniref:Uncharacterized protein n=1 Tax=Legionella busanensis TaxID=190655 RepID=A0A378JPM6_9GAMM|nr:hypothetical protein [Legionella busanensis]STX52149.1 Uncharacterised protein [Legionella busanensis]